MCVVCGVLESRCSVVVWCVVDRPRNVRTRAHAHVHTVVPASPCRYDIWVKSRSCTLERVMSTAPANTSPRGGGVGGFSMTPRKALEVSETRQLLPEYLNLVY